MHRALAIVLGLLSISIAAPVMGQEPPPQGPEAQSEPELTAGPRAAEEAAPDEDAPDVVAPDVVAPDVVAPQEVPPDEVASDADTPDADADDEAASSEAPPGWTDGKAAGWVTLIASVLVGVGGGVLLAVGADDVNTIENAPGGTRWAAVDDAYARAPILTGVGAVVLGLGAAGTLLGATLLSIHGGEGTWLRASVGPGSVAIRARF